MVMLAARTRVDEFWATAFGLDVADMHLPGVRLQTHHGAQTQRREIHVLVFGDAVSVLVPAALTTRISDVLAARPAVTAETALDPQWWADRLAEPGAQTSGPSVHHYLDDGSRLDEYTAGRRLNPDDFTALNTLRGGFDTLEWGHAGFDELSPILFGLFEDEQLVAAANLGPGPEASSDVGVATRSDMRGRGYGTGLAATAAKQAIGLHGVARYRALATDQAGLALARRLGFDEYGRHLVISLPE